MVCISLSFKTWHGGEERTWGSISFAFRFRDWEGSSWLFVFFWMRHEWISSSSLNWCWNLYKNEVALGALPAVGVPAQTLLELVTVANLVATTAVVLSSVYLSTLTVPRCPVGRVGLDFEIVTATTAANIMRLIAPIPELTVPKPLKEGADLRFLPSTAPTPTTASTTTAATTSTATAAHLATLPRALSGARSEALLRLRG